MTIAFAAVAANNQGAIHPALNLVEHGTAAIRINAEASKRDAEAALALLQRQPDADLEIRARLLLCDYYSERDAAAAAQQILLSNALLSRAKRSGLRAGVLSCQGETAET